ncbi:MAG: hypothetical protein ACKVJX_03970 [Verrucomicrobiia bacterium]
MEPKLNQAWRKSRIAARLWLRKQERPWNDRDRELASALADDPAVSNRLIQQAIYGLKARSNGHRLMDKQA